MSGVSERRVYESWDLQKEMEATDEIFFMLENLLITWFVIQILLGENKI